MAAHVFRQLNIVFRRCDNAADAISLKNASAGSRHVLPGTGSIRSTVESTMGEEKSSPQKHQKETRLLNKPGHKLKAGHNHPPRLCGEPVAYLFLHHKNSVLYAVKFLKQFYKKRVVIG